MPRVPLEGYRLVSDYNDEEITDETSGGNLSTDSVGLQGANLSVKVIGVALIIAGGLLDLFGLLLAPLYNLSWWPSGQWFLPLFLLSMVLWGVGAYLWYL